jgi:hypothetical protein
MEHDLRAALDAIGYVTRYGIEWRALPVTSRRARRCMPFRSVERARLAAGAGGPAVRAAAHSLGPGRAPDRGLDRLSVGEGRGHRRSRGRGYDAGKRIKGRKRHVVDPLGLLLVGIVTAASVQDREGAFRLLAGLRERFSSIARVGPMAAMPAAW